MCTWCVEPREIVRGTKTEARLSTSMASTLRGSAASTYKCLNACMAYACVRPFRNTLSLADAWQLLGKQVSAASSPKLGAAHRCKLASLADGVHTQLHDAYLLGFGQSQKLQWLTHAAKAFAIIYFC